MKILHINGTYYPSGGAETYLRNLCRMQIGAGHQVSLTYASNLPAGLPRESWVYSIGGSWGIRTGFATRKRILNFIEDKAPDVIHMHVVHFSFSPIVLKAIIQRWPVVYTIHDILWLCLKECTSATFTNSARILSNGDVCDRPLSLNCLLKGCVPSFSKKEFLSQLRFQSITFWRRAVFKQVSKIVVNSAYVANFLRKNNFPREKIRLIKPYLSVPETWKRNSLSDSSLHQNKVVLFIGKLSKHKGIFDLIDAASLLKTKKWKLVIIGDGEEKNNLLSYVHRKNVSHRVVFCGALERDQLGTHYRNAEIVVLPSRCPETFGLVGLEAMYFGKPVIAYDVGAIGEWLDNDYAGYLVKSGDINKLSEKIDTLLEDRKLLQKMGSYGRQRARSFMAKEQFLKKILITYEEASEGFHGKIPLRA